MKIRKFISTLLLCGGFLSVQAQLYQTSGTANYTPAAIGNTYSAQGAIPTSHSAAPVTETPYSNQRFSSTTVMQNGSYTIMFSAQDMSAGVAQEPAYISPIFKAPTGPGGPSGPGSGIGGGNDPGDIVVDVNPLPIGDNIWLLLACATMLFAFRAWLTLRMKKV